MKKPKIKYKHVRVFLVPDKTNYAYRVGSRLEYSVPVGKVRDCWETSIDLKLTDCDRSIHWDIELNKSGEAKLIKAIAVLEQLLEDVKAASKLPEAK